MHGGHAYIDVVAMHGGHAYTDVVAMHAHSYSF
jgi:hypothetical protein